jgi:hypothetical protein
VSGRIPDQDSLSPRRRSTRPARTASVMSGTDFERYTSGGLGRLSAAEVLAFGGESSLKL